MSVLASTHKIRLECLYRPVTMVFEVVACLGYYRPHDGSCFAVYDPNTQLLSTGTKSSVIVGTHDKGFNAENLLYLGPGSCNRLLSTNVIICPGKALV